MTTIATDGKSMAGDGISIMDGTIIDTSSIKVEKLSDGSLFGACGSASDAMRLAAFLNAGGEGDWPKRSDNFGAIVVRPDGGVFTVSEHDGLVKARAPIAMGSGGDYALGAMDAGASPAEAVGIAIRRDPRSGGLITEVLLA
jgi:ATP-dependent protease HslVU (ClpYQ) peptidase subunit